jgi:very-short-patch-repair endonuclease
MTPAERTLWQLLRADQLRGFRFQRQAAIGPYIADFVCFSQIDYRVRRAAACRTAGTAT